MKTNMLTKNGSVSAYAFSCGDCEFYKNTKIRMEHGVYLVTWADDTTNKNWCQKGFYRLVNARKFARNIAS